MGDIIQAGIGPINIVECVNDPDSCMKAEWCECRPLYVLLNRKITDALNTFSLADLAEHKIKQAVAEELASAESGKTPPCEQEKGIRIRR